MMKNALFLLWMYLLLFGTSEVSALPCVADTLDKYIMKGFSCTVEDKLFSKFNYSSTFNNAGMIADGPPANMIQVAPITVPPGQPASLNPGLAFSSAAWSVLNLQSIDAVIDYAVTVMPGGHKIKDGSLDLRGFRTKDGSIKDDKDLSAAGLRMTLQTFWSMQNNQEQKQLHDEKQFGLTSYIDARDRFSLNGGATGTAQISEIDNQFSEDPKARTNLPPGAPKNKGTSDGSVIAYDGLLQRLSFTGDRMTDTGFPGDPVLMASVNIPDFLFNGVATGGDLLFQAATDGVFDISNGANVFMAATIPVLVYVPATNSFYGEMTNPQFPGVDSPWIAAMAALFNPSSPSFDPDLLLYFTYNPRDDMLNLTQGFTVNGTSGGPDGIFAAAPVPEPGTSLLVGFGIVGLLAATWQRRRGEGCESLPRASDGLPDV